jgi:hypothetical protein
MALTTLDGLVAANRKKYIFQKASATSKVASALHSLWKIAGIPAAGATPPSGVGEVPTKSTIGAFLFAVVGGGTSIYLGRMACSGATSGTLILYDRLVHTSGLVGNVATEQTVNSTALSRYTDGVGVEAFLETYAATGASAANITVKYTDELGNTGQTVTFAHQVTTVIGQMQQVPGILGCRQIESVQFSATTGTAGDFGIVLAKRLAEIPIDTASGKVLGPFEVGLPTVHADACLALMVVCSTTNTGIINGASIDLLQG